MALLCLFYLTHMSDKDLGLLTLDGRDLHSLSRLTIIEQLMDTINPLKSCDLL